MPCKNTCPSCIDWFCYTFPWHQQLRSKWLASQIFPKASWFCSTKGASWSAKQNIFGVSLSCFTGWVLWPCIKDGPKWPSTPISLVKIGMGGFPPKEHDPTRKTDARFRDRPSAFRPSTLLLVAGCLHLKSQDLPFCLQDGQTSKYTFWGGVWLVCFGVTKYHAWGGRPGCQRKDTFFVRDQSQSQ